MSDKILSPEDFADVLMHAATDAPPDVYRYREMLVAHDRALRDAVAVLTEERDAIETQLTTVTGDWLKAEHQVAVLEAGLIPLILEERWHEPNPPIPCVVVRRDGGMTYMPLNGPAEEVTEARALLGRVPAAVSDESRAVAAGVMAQIPDEAFDRTGPAAAPEPDAWAPETQELAIVNRALTAAEQDRVYELVHSGTPIADALRTVAQEGDIVTEGPLEEEHE
jgi:hypothetical protein